jgi:hypothetical protein
MRLGAAIWLFFLGTGFVGGEVPFLEFYLRDGRSVSGDYMGRAGGRLQLRAAGQPFEVSWTELSRGDRLKYFPEIDRRLWAFARTVPRRTVIPGRFRSFWDVSSYPDLTVSLVPVAGYPDKFVGVAVNRGDAVVTVNLLLLAVSPVRELLAVDAIQLRDLAPGDVVQVGIEFGYPAGTRVEYVEAVEVR